MVPPELQLQQQELPSRLAAAFLPRKFYVKFGPLAVASFRSFTFLARRRIEGCPTRTNPTNRRKFLQTGAAAMAVAASQTHGVALAQPSTTQKQPDAWKSPSTEMSFVRIEGGKFLDGVARRR